MDKLYEVTSSKKPKFYYKKQQKLSKKIPENI